MKPRSPIRRVSEKKQKELSGKNSFGLKFNSTIRRKTCDATIAVPTWRGKDSGNTTDSISVYRKASNSQQHTPIVKSILEPNFGNQRKPVKKQSEGQRKRLQKLAAVRRRWWKESESSGKQLICGICDEPIRWFEDLASDHINPGSAKSDDESNLQPAHAATCNMIKGSRRDFKIVRGDKNWKLIHGEL